VLSLLHIENIAVIEQADISFDRGFNILTGETGAGKSIVIDAISAILGERAYRDMIRTGANMASVRAVFTDVPELPWFQENGVEYDAETIIQRQIHLDGKNVCRVNGSLVTVSILRKLGIQPGDTILMHSSYKSMGPMEEILAQMPGGANLKGVKVDEKAMARTEAIILSMTPKERENPNIIAASRKKRIAAGAGVKVEDVNRLLKSFEQMRSMIKQFTGPGAGKKMKRMKGLGGFGGGFPGF
jgi:energy-coupling factor transporter ATP-binding protein EcfA2